MIPTFQQGQLGRSVRSGAATDANAVALYNAMVAYWEFEQNDATTQFLDSHNSNHLSLKRNDTGATVTTSSMSAASGVPGRNFRPYNGTNNASAYIPRANTALDFPNSDFSFGGWFTGTNNGGVGGSTCFLMGRLGSAVANVQAYLYIEGSDSKVYMRASNDGTTLTTTPGASSVAVSTGPNLVVATFDRANNLLRLRIKRVTGSVSVNVTQAFASALYTTSSTVNFCINGGMNSDNTWFSGSRYFDGQASPVIDGAFYCTRAITDAEFDYLYNSGSGRSYAQLKADAGH